MESQIRDLGGEYECFNLPYWDWAYEVNRIDENQNDNLEQTSDFYVLNSGLGGNGDQNDDWCINDSSLFSKNNGYEPVRDCPPENNNGNCCLKRMNSLSILDFADSTLFAQLIATNSQYSDFRSELEMYHNWAHVRIGGSGGIGQLNSRYSPDDPIFFLIHAYIDYIWSLWQDCYNYETLNIIQAANTPAAYQGDEVNTYPLDPLNFEILASNGWARIRRMLYYYCIIFINFLCVYSKKKKTKQANGAVIRNPGVIDDILSPDVTHAIRNMHNIAWWDVKYENDYLYDAVSQWFVDEGIINCNNLPEVIGGAQQPGRITSFTDSTWNELTNGIFRGNNTISLATAQSLFKSLARINCEMRQSRGGKNPCKRPKCFDDCSDLIPCDYSTTKQDVNVTLDQLIEKVIGYPCMIETRRVYYSWAKETGDLLALCRGDYDNFCDDMDNIIRSDSALNSCPVSASYAEAVVEHYENLKENTYNSHSTLFKIDNHSADDDNNNFNEWFKFDYNTLIIIIIMVVAISVGFNVGCFYLMNKKTRFKYLDDNQI